MTTDSAKAVPMAELTLRGVILGALITLLFTAANVYLGLKIGLTFATSPCVHTRGRGGSSNAFFCRGTYWKESFLFNLLTLIFAIHVRVGI